jgi:hypothetical protein
MPAGAPVPPNYPSYPSGDDLSDDDNDAEPMSAESSHAEQEPAGEIISRVRMCNVASVFCTFSNIQPLTARHAATFSPCAGADCVCASLRPGSCLRSPTARPRMHQPSPIYTNLLGPPRPSTRRSRCFGPHPSYEPPYIPHVLIVQLPATAMRPSSPSSSPWASQNSNGIACHVAFPFFTVNFNLIA